MAYHDEEYEQDMVLARQLKDRYCDQSGKETDIENSAKIIHQIGLIYRKRSPDKIALIKSAGLINAAIFRNPSNTSQIKSDLFELCRHILQQSDAKNQSADLIKKAEEVKASITGLRKKVNVFLTKVPQIPNHATRQNVHTLIAQKISPIQQINKTIACKYKSIMADIGHYCENVMGKPPCEYAIVGMGSLAREEITAYSDFEHIILLFDDVNYKFHLEYFRWFSVVFHIIVINVQESIIAGFNIHCLNSKDCSLGDWFYDAITKRGVSFDGMMPHACKFPLGRQQHTKNKPFTTELIKPVSEMLEYLSSDADLKNGYHLADILTKTCFVYGNQIIFEQFKNGTQNYLDKRSETDTINDVEKQVRDDLDIFSTRFRLKDLKLQTTINIKQLVYRSTTLFVSALATKHKILGNSSFDLIEQMANNKAITQNAAQKLKYAIAIACEMRLKIYMRNQSQCDNAINLNQDDGMKMFLDIVGVASTVNYFQIAYCLQCEVAKQLNFTKFHFYADPQLINIAISLAFGIANLARFSKNPQKQFWEPNKFDFDICIEKLEKESETNLKNLNRRSVSKQTVSFYDCCGFKNQFKFNPNEKLICNVANYLYSVEIYDEALEFLQLKLNTFKNKSRRNWNHHEVASAHHDIGCCLFHLHQPTNAIEYLETALAIKQTITVDASKDKCIAVTLNTIGNCYSKLQNYNDALNFLNRALQIHQNATLNKDTVEIGVLLYSIGNSHSGLQNYNKALNVLNRSLQILNDTTLNANADVNIAETLQKIAYCHNYLQNYHEALTLLNKSLLIKYNIALNVNKDYRIACTLYEIGCCDMNLQNYNKALTTLNRSLQIQQSITLNSDKDTYIAYTLHGIGRCHYRLQNYDEALTVLIRSLQIKKTTSLNADKDDSIRVTLDYIGLCQMHFQNYSEALTFFNRSLQILESITLNADEDTNIVITLNEISRCHNHLLNYNEALTVLSRLLQIQETTTSNANKNKSIALTLHEIGCCQLNLQSYIEALTTLSRSLHILQSVTLNPDKDSSIANTLRGIGCCHYRLQNYDEALTVLNRSLKIQETITLNVYKDKNIAVTLLEIGLSHMHLQNYNEALTFLNRSLQVKQNVTLDADKHVSIGNTLREIGLYHMHLKNYKQALTVLYRSLQIQENTTSNADKDSSIALTLHDIGCCHNHLQKYNEALAVLNRSLRIKETTTSNVNKYKSIAVTLYEIACCHHHLQNYNEALVVLNSSLQIKQSTTVSADKDVEKMLFATGCNYCCLQNYEKALTYFYRSLQTSENTADDEAKQASLDAIRFCQKMR